MGNIKRLRYYSKNKCYNEIIMKKASDKQGYQIISLSKNKKRKTYRVHRLIAKTFIENPQNKKEDGKRKFCHSYDCKPPSISINQDYKLAFKASINSWYSASVK